MKYLKNVEQFNEELLGLKSLGLGKSNEEKVKKEYDRLLGEIAAMKTMKPDDAMETMANYINELNKIGKLNDFKSTDDVS